MKKALIHILPILLLLLSSEAFAQQVAWYSYDQTYYKIPTAKDGIYRISPDVLTASGIDINNLDPRNIQLFHRGKEVAIYISGEDDGKLDPSDYIDFYGIRNDGTLDSLLYTKFDKLPNPYFNTHSDTTAFFLTVSLGQQGMRMNQRNAPQANQPIVNSYASEKLEVFGEQYSLGVGYAFDFRLSSYDQGQGWMSTLIRKGDSRQVTFSGLGSPRNSGTAQLEIGLVGRSLHNHVARISAGPNANSQRVIQTQNYYGYEYPQLTIPLNMSDFNPDGSLVITLESIGTEGADNQSIAYAKIVYQENVVNGEFDTELFILPPGNQQIKIPQVTGNYEALEISDYYQPEKVELLQSGGELSFQGAIVGDSSKVWVQSEASLIPVERMKTVNFKNYLSQEADYILVGHHALEIPADQFQNPLQSYAEHRASPLGGGYKTLTIFMEEIYDQYGYGEEGPTALFEFLRTYYPAHQPTHLLLAGRSLTMYSTARQNGVNYFYRNNPSAFSFQNLVPPGGYPTADNNFVVGLDPSQPLVPAMAVGRIPAKNSQHLADYLSKAIEKDAVGVSEPWQKELIHLSGGVSEFELNRYFNFLNNYKTIAEGLYLGGNVTTYRKRSNSTVELIDITGDLNEGRSLVTFFGHGSPTVIDIEIGFASDPTLNYQNRGKYPVMLFNGCDYGNAYGTVYTQSEDWVITPEKGASNVMANTAIGVDVILNRYSDSFYSTAFADSSSIYKTVGEVKQLGEIDFVNRYGTSPLSYSHMEQMVLLGDPGVRMFPADKADYSLDETEVFFESFNEDPLNALSDSIKLTFVLRNIGIVNTDSVTYQIKRKLPDGTEFSYDAIEIPYVSRKDTLVFSVPNIGINAAGDNVFTLEVNKARSIPELTYTNNSISVTEFIPLSGTMNLYPLNYGIVSETDVNLVSQIPGKTNEERTIILQLDSTSNFNSAFRKEIRITTSGLVDWPVSLMSSGDSATYFWRSKFQEPQAGENDAWTQSSFSLIPNGPSGWTQRTISQLEENQLENLEVNPQRNAFKYVDKKLGFEVFTVGAGVDTLSFRNTQFYLDQVPQIIDNVNNANSRLCPNGSLGLVAFDQKSLMPYLAIPVPGFDILDSRACGRVPQVIQSIQNSWITTPGQTVLEQYVKGVKEGDFVVIFSVGNVTFDAWPDEAYALLKEFGANEATLRNLQTGDPYILYGQKGMNPGEAMEIIGKSNQEFPPNQQTLSFKTDLEGYFTQGMIITPRVGPASNWERFFQNVNARTWINEEEFTYFDVLGVKNDGSEELILENTYEEEIALDFIDAETYPYLRLRYRMNDPNSTAPAQLDRWQVNYSGVPEGALTVNTSQEQINLREGEQTSIGMSFKNISKYNFLDSIQVNWKWTNVASKKVEEFSKKFPALKAGESFEFAIDFSSIGKGGVNELEVFANPRIQQEQTFRNNQVDFGPYVLVEADESSSVLDVNFDGIYIMDGDIVSPTVMVTAQLINDQTLLYKKDTVGLDIFLKQNCESCEYKRVNFSDPNLNWSPASEDARFKVSFLPGPLEDGMYTLRVANADSEEPYEISFEVINESQITNFYPYPNPFSTSVRFVFTVTGAEVPDEIKIQIMTVTGKVVREILQNELGPLRIGNNITEYAWDGKDEFGDQLANGVYIYRVLVRKDGQFMEHRPTAGDKAFKKGYGKMYLLR
ncbi:putative type IX secretion system sortase PorU2 [Algoriphagus machipongonensis]|uniref:Outer membrane insertion C- signal n=1 Tax=Algoriphagus machipongonensis TaxID=388413 RepID=A3HW99_9BACT|nr:C25 family cysteine peptidase [Algoriphagus machipongonensis]EAZ80872.1 putative outer membrane insertion C- signal [Algoriphagus machipongonensis]